MKTVAEILIEKRKENGYTLREVASAIGVSSQLVHYAEDLEYPKISDNLLDRLCVFYGLDGKKLTEQFHKEHKEVLQKRKDARREKRWYE